MSRSEETPHDSLRVVQLPRPRLRPHSKSPSRSPTRTESRSVHEVDSLHPAFVQNSTSEGLDEAPTGALDGRASLQDLDRSIAQASMLERELGMRAAAVSERLRQWHAEVSSWQWPGVGGPKISTGFEVPSIEERASKRRRLSEAMKEQDQVPDLGSGGKMAESDETGVQQQIGTILGEAEVEENEEYWGSCPARLVKRYQDRIDAISDGIAALGLEELEERVLDAHIPSRTRPSSSHETHPSALTQSTLVYLDDLTAFTTATILQALPYLCVLSRYLETWSTRLAALRVVPHFLKSLEDARLALQSGWYAIGVRDERISRTTPLRTKDPSRAPAADDSDPSKPVTPTPQSDLTLDGFKTIRAVLAEKINSVGQQLYKMLHILQDGEDAMPNEWIEGTQRVKAEYGDWVCEAEGVVRENELRRARIQRLQTDESAGDKSQQSAGEKPPSSQSSSQAENTAHETGRVGLVNSMPLAKLTDETLPTDTRLQSSSPSEKVTLDSTTDPSPKVESRNDPLSEVQQKSFTAARGVASEELRNLQTGVPDALNRIACMGLGDESLTEFEFPITHRRSNKVSRPKSAPPGTLELNWLERIRQRKHNMRNGVSSDDMVQYVSALSPTLAYGPRNEHNFKDVSSSVRGLLDVQKRLLESAASMGPSLTEPSTPLQPRLAEPLPLNPSLASSSTFPESSPNPDTSVPESGLAFPDYSTASVEGDVFQPDGLGSMSVGSVTRPEHEVPEGLSLTNSELGSSVLLDSSETSSKEVNTANDKVMPELEEVRTPSEFPSSFQHTAWKRPAPITVVSPTIEGPTTPSSASSYFSDLSSPELQDAHAAVAYKPVFVHSRPSSSASMSMLMESPSPDPNEDASHQARYQGSSPRDAPLRRQRSTSSPTEAFRHRFSNRFQSESPSGVDSDLEVLKRASVASVELVDRASIKSIEVRRRRSQPLLGIIESKKILDSSSSSSLVLPSRTGILSDAKEFVLSEDGEATGSLQAGFEHDPMDSVAGSETRAKSNAQLETSVTEDLTHVTVTKQSGTSPLLPGTSPAPTQSPSANTTTWAKVSANKNADISREDQLELKISSILTTIPAHIRLTSEDDAGVTPGNKQKPDTPDMRSAPRSRKPLVSANSYTLAPAKPKGPGPRTDSESSEVKLYHLRRGGGEAPPIKLFVRLVGDNSERVMVRVGGGWADLGDYLREYATHHGRRSVSDGAGLVEIRQLPSTAMTSTPPSSSRSHHHHHRESGGRSTPGSHGNSTTRPLSSLGRPTPPSRSSFSQGTWTMTPGTPSPVPPPPNGSARSSRPAARPHSRLSWTTDRPDDEDEEKKDLLSTRSSNPNTPISTTNGGGGLKVNKRLDRHLLSAEKQAWVDDMIGKVRRGATVTPSTTVIGSTPTTATTITSSSSTTTTNNNNNTPVMMMPGLGDIPPSPSPYPFPSSSDRRHDNHSSSTTTTTTTSTTSTSTSPDSPNLPFTTTTMTTTTNPAVVGSRDRNLSFGELGRVGTVRRIFRRTE